MKGSIVRNNLLLSGKYLPFESFGQFDFPPFFQNNAMLHRIGFNLRYERLGSVILKLIVLVLNTQHFFNSLFNEGERHKVFNLALFESCKGFDFENLFSALLIQATEQLVSESFATAI